MPCLLMERLQQCNAGQDWKYSAGMEDGEGGFVEC